MERKRIQIVAAALIFILAAFGIAHAAISTWRYFDRIQGQSWIYTTTESSIKNLPSDSGVCFDPRERFNMARVWLNGTGAVNATLQFSQSKLNAKEAIFAFQNANDTHTATFTSDNTQAFTVTNEQGNCFRLRLDFADATNTVTRAHIDFDYDPQ